MPRGVLYVTNNEMGVATDGTLVSLPSQRIAQYERVAQQLEERHEWKSSGQGAQFMNRRNPFAGASQKTGTITAVWPLNESEMLYTVIFPMESGGVYRKSYVQPNDVEGLVCADIGLFAHDMHVRERSIALSVAGIREQRHIGLMSLDSPGIQYVTEGDTMDTAPYISPDGQWVYYASAGYARNEQNVMLQRGPMSLLRINLRTSALEELKGSAEMDYMRPKVAADGTLYYIQRPYTGQTRQTSLKDALLAPVHFVVGFFRFFALFGKLFSNVPRGIPLPAP